MSEFKQAMVIMFTLVSACLVWLGHVDKAIYAMTWAIILKLETIEKQIEVKK